MAAPTYVTSMAVVADTAAPASTVPSTVTAPGHAVDDILIVVAQNSNGDAMASVTAGWTQEANATMAGTDDFFWCWRRATSTTDTGPTITATGVSQFAVCIAIRGCTTSGIPFENATLVSDFTTATTTPSTGAITTSGAERLVLAITAVPTSGGFASGRPPAGWTAVNNSSSASGTTCQFWSSSRTEATATNISAATVGTYAGSFIYAGLILAFIPPGADPIPEQIRAPLEQPGSQSPDDYPGYGE